MRTPDPNSTDNKFVTALFGKYIPKSQRTKQQNDLYYKTVSVILKSTNERLTALIKEIKDAGLMCPKLLEIFKETKNFGRMNVFREDND